MTNAAKGKRGLLGLLCLINVLNPLSMDMYTPAVPQMAANLNTTDMAVGYSMTLYFLVCSFAMLVSGTLSDKLGRKAVMRVNGVLFAIGSILCAVAPSIEVLLAARCLCAWGSGALFACATAVAGDAYEAEQRGKVLASMQIGMLVGPVVAPLLGALILQVVNWRGIFALISVVGVVCAVWTFIIPETLPVELRLQGPLKTAFSSLVRVAKDGWLMRVVVLRGAHIVAFMGFVAGGSFIYETMFGFTPLEYSLAFGFTGVCMAASAFLLGLLGHRIGMNKVIWGMVLVSIACGFVVLAVGKAHWLLVMLPVTLFCALNLGMQPEFTNAILASRESEAGAASSVMNFVGNMLGTVGMFLIALPFGDYVLRQGVLIIVFMAVALVAWLGILKSPITDKFTSWK